jgi:hypothetical protein
MLDGCFVIRTILEPLQSCMADGQARDAKFILKERGFDVAGVQESENGPVLGFVFREELGHGGVRDHLKPLNASDLISDGSSFADLFSFLRIKERSFILVGSSVGGIVTRADLNKPPVRVYLFGMISLLEMHLQYWVQETYPGDSWHAVLKEKRLKKAKKYQEDRRAHGEELALLDCLQFCDKSFLVAKDTNLLAKLKLASKTEAEERFKDAENLRNHLAHSQLDLAQGTSWDALLDLIGRIISLLQCSDELVAQGAQPKKEDLLEV